MCVWGLGQVGSSCQVCSCKCAFGHQKKIFFPKMWLQMLANTAYAVYQTMAVAFTRTEGCFTCSTMVFLCCFNSRDLPGLCSIGFHWKKKIKGLKGRFKVVLMRILLWIQSLNLDAPSSLRGDGRCSSGLCWPKATLGVPQPEKCPPAQQHTQGPGIGARVSGCFRTSLCDRVKSSALSRLQFSQKQNGDNKDLPPGTVRG